MLCRSTLAANRATLLWPGRKPFSLTAEQRRVVLAITGFGVPHIALVMCCSPPTLRKCFRHELDTAVIEANARVAQTLYQQATKPGKVAATIFWLKARAGWRKKHAVELSGPGETAIKVVFRSPHPKLADAGPSLLEGVAE